MGDDLSAFWLIRTQSWRAYLTVLLGGQLVILHRASTAFLYWLAPMHSGVAVAVLTALQLATASGLSIFDELGSALEGLSKRNQFD